VALLCDATSACAKVALLCDATSACAKDHGGGCGAGTTVVEGSAIRDGAALEGAAVGNNNFVCQSNGIAIT